MAEGPGRTVKGVLLSRAALRSRCPGSERQGVPASETMAICSPDEARWRSSGMRCCSLWSWREVRGFEISR